MDILAFMWELITGIPILVLFVFMLAGLCYFMEVVIINIKDRIKDWIKMHKGFILPKFWYYFISFTWGLPLTLIGCLVSLVLIVLGHAPRSNIYGWYFEVGNHWGGCSIGPCTLMCKEWDIDMATHEFGHSIQNCIFGSVLMLFFVIIPSVCRYWYRRIKKVTEPEYDYAWFEGQASMFGKRYWAATQEKYLE